MLMLKLILTDIDTGKCQSALVSVHTCILAEAAAHAAECAEYTIRQLLT